MVESTLYPRFAAERISEALADTPAVLIHGPRQSGKTTLAQQLGQAAGYSYLTFDDTTAQAAARDDPVGFVERLPPRTVLDEVQRAPELFAALKFAIDRDRRPGRFLLTGSANVLLLPQLADSLAGRLEVLRLYPLAQCEIEGVPPRFLDEFFAGTLKIRHAGRLGSNLIERIVGGGYPEALRRTRADRRREWYRHYMDTLVQRDVRDLARISQLDLMPRLLAMAATQTARLLNMSSLAAPFQVSRPTIRDYAQLLERIFLINTLPPWYSNRIKRLIKTPKLHLSDTGLASSLLGTSASQLMDDRALLGQLLETFVFNELQRQASWHERLHSFFHYRDKDDYEVDIVIERDGRQLAAVEVKAAATVTERDFRGLKRLQQAAGKRFATGAVLYDGEHLFSFGERLFAVPVSALWGE
ncbi:MAG: ATP-binding protein [Burkholderiales bacterium]